MTPAIVIELELEAKAPKVLVRSMSEGQEARLMDWLRAQDDLCDLVTRALEIAEEAQAA